jgi:small subunit ribosomal protein S15
VETEKRNSLVAEFRVHEKDTGSSQVQVALLTQRINELTEHLKAHPHDFHSQRGLMMLIGQRRRLLTYLNRHNLKGYRSVVEKLKLRK